MTLEDALTALKTHEKPGHAESAAAYHKVPRPYLGVPNPALNDLATEWRRSLTLQDRLTLADDLWQTDIHEARIVAAKLLTQARIRPSDQPVWHLLCSWIADFDSWAIADHVSKAGERRIMADLSRLDHVEYWTESPHMWTRRSALVMTLGLTRLNHPSAEEAAARERVLGWAARYVDDPQWFIQKAVAWWLRDLSKHDPDRVRAFLDRHGEDMRGFARKEAGKYL
ncbi:DNA alkylation repair protein [Pseudooceanicola sediminis]|uniref:DNA alkylation repair protein n=1 Tax=Pseudooceanicola sediminis TaxID=2211117 RepID=A0A399J108_9RHOB|nr:DNA alkylation repair protein [Pseudooceanicola sediminis]KAA2316195.1 DNA alkylation repair protein [Puniceibacterium sp. HSS470]RII39108.1 DNA alkylation repair protein [Pseudooceanicola sediminis]|tara:strand:- start:69418 stop:70095 length:678 start_codon:yes stop_codon:yes gene_type:complete